MCESVSLKRKKEKKRKKERKSKLVKYIHTLCLLTFSWNVLHIHLPAVLPFHRNKTDGKRSRDDELRAVLSLSPPMSKGPKTRPALTSSKVRDAGVRLWEEGEKSAGMWPGCIFIVLHWRGWKRGNSVSSEDFGNYPHFCHGRHTIMRITDVSYNAEYIRILFCRAQHIA